MANFSADREEQTDKPQRDGLTESELIECLDDVWHKIESSEFKKIAPSKDFVSGAMTALLALGFRLAVQLGEIDSSEILTTLENMAGKQKSGKMN